MTYVFERGQCPVCVPSRFWLDERRLHNSISCVLLSRGFCFSGPGASSKGKPRTVQLAASPSMSKAVPKECMALLKEASEMFSETGCVPGIDGEEVPAETIVPDVKEYISETIDDPEAIYDPKIWDASGFALVLSWLAQKWNQRCRKLAPRGSKNPEQNLTKEQQKACLDSAAAELIREITQGRSLN
jgi:hypothetical protein